MSQGRHRVVIVGGGFGGIKATRALARADVDITIVDRTNHHLFQPLLYQVATGILPDGLIAPALRSVVSKQANARVVLADVQHLDLDGRVVHALAPDGQKLMLSYDSLVVAAGCTDAYFGHDEWAVFAPGLKTLEDAGHLRSHILGAFEMAELATDPAERAAYLTFAVIGAGPTGVQVAGQIAELAHETLPREYKSVATTEAKILLIEAGPQVLGTFASQAAALHAAAAAADGRRGMAEHHGARHGLRQCHRHGPRRGQAHSGPDKNLGGRGTWPG
jgi:NADH dehydrogenase